MQAHGWGQSYNIAIGNHRWEKYRGDVLEFGKHMQSLHRYLYRGFRTGLDALVPPRCICCQAVLPHENNLCAGCWCKFRFIERPYCECLGTPFSVDLGLGTLSTQAIASPPPFRRLRAAVVYNDAARMLVSRLKYGDQHEAVAWMARQMQRCGSELVEDAHMIVPLPLHWRRMMKRRFNQSAELARLIARHTGTRLHTGGLKRIKHTRQQVGLDFAKRQRNMMGAFGVSKDHQMDFKGQNVLVVDDVYTSGASVRAASRTLLRAGAQQVDILTFAKVPLSGL